MRPQTKTLKGSSIWALAYALTSLRNYPVRNVGIALVLAIGVSLPTTVFVWTATGTDIVVEDFFDETVYQLSMRPGPGESFDSSDIEGAIDFALGHKYVDSIDLIPSTTGILIGDFLPSWVSYSMYSTNYLFGVKDMRVFLLTEEMLERWSSEFEVEGNFSLSPGQVLISEQFVSYTEDVHGFEFGVGDVMHVDVHSRLQPNVNTPTRENLRTVTVDNLTIAGVYDPVRLTSLIGQSFTSFSRQNWDPFKPPDESVLGTDDSIIILQSEVEESTVDEILSYGFPSAALVRASKDGLLADGAQRIGDNLEALEAQMEEQYGDISYEGLEEVWRLEAYVSTYISSQVLTIVAFPVLIMSLMLTVFTSETSVSRRKGEISALRSKGASFNQVFSTFMWESLFLSIIGFVLGIGLSFVMAPLVGATTALFVFDFTMYGEFLTHLSMPILALIIAGAIAMYLPAAYLLHVARRIDVSEVGQPTVDAPDDEGAEDASIWRYVIGLASILTALVLFPYLLDPFGSFAVGNVLIATGLLFAASYVGSRAMRLATAKLSGGTSFLMGEKSLYMSQSLRRRKGQFIPLLVILTLTLTTTTMMLIQTDSFEATIYNELDYAIGADMRVETSGRPFDFNYTIMQYPGVVQATPVVESWAKVGTNNFFLESVDPYVYLQVGHFKADSFVSGTPEEVLTALAETNNSIVLSEHYMDLWNKTVGDTINIFFGTDTSDSFGVFEIVGVMRSAPGFGIASTEEISSASFAASFGFQAGQGGFALTNLNFMAEYASYDTAEVFLVDTLCFTEMGPVIDALQAGSGQDVYTVETFDIDSQSYSIRLFLSGIQGISTISFILCAAMGLSSIALFLGSAVMDREKEYAVFRALGGTKKQVISMVFSEFAGSVIAAISISAILGIVFGYSMSVLTFGIAPFSPVLGELLSFPLLVMMGVLALESVVMLASCYIPASRAGSVDPATSLRNL